jgi:hypothetical protein
VVAVRFCPMLFELKPATAELKTSPAFDLPYRMLFAVATIDRFAPPVSQR